MYTLRPQPAAQVTVTHYPHTMPRTLRAADLARIDRYKLLSGAVVPRPIAFVSTVSTEGLPNLAPYSHYNALGADPMTLTFAPANNEDGTEKDTLRNCKPVSEGGTGEFVVNVAVASYIREVSAAAEMLEHGVSEFELIGLTAEPSELVKAPRVKESPISFECKTLQVVRTNGNAPGGGNLVIGEVVAIHIQDDELVNDRYHVDPARLDAIGRMSGLGYCTTRDRFDLVRGRDALNVDPPCQ